jgi:hypothetical protein
MPKWSSKRDVAQNALRVVEEAIGEPLAKNPAAVALGRRGGLKGGRARAINLTPERRAEIAKKRLRCAGLHQKRSDSSVMAVFQELS